MPRKKTQTGSTESVENFLKAVYALEQGLNADAGDRVSTNALSESLNISAPSVTDMAQRLDEEGLIDYQRYKGIRLTGSGTDLALKVLRRHRLIELFLVQELGYELHEVHEEAEALEHAVSDRFVQALVDKLGDPAVDPHGDPIPNDEGVMATPLLVPLAALEHGQTARVARFAIDNNEMLQYALSKGFQLNRVLQLSHREPYGGPITVRWDDGEVVIGTALAETILVELDP
jgi:DtxR family Mn-dependent transcriptional regulator